MADSMAESRAANAARQRRYRARKRGDDTLLAELEADRMAAWIRRTVDKAPPLSDAQRERLALLLAPGQQ